MAEAGNANDVENAHTLPVERVRTQRARSIMLPTWGVRGGDTIGERWIIGHVIGKGSFGFVHVCQCSNTQEICAVKIEQRDPNNRTVTRERVTLQAMMGVEGFPSIRDFGTEGDYHWTVETLLGSTLQSMMEFCGGHFSLFTTVHIADQALARIESLHREGFIHRDIKPANFMLGVGRARNTVHMCDFGLSKSYLDENRSHIAFKNKLPLIGTMRYASIYNHKGLEQSRRDDLESWWFMLVYFLRGSLPWEVAAGKDKEEKKKTTLLLKVEMSMDMVKSLPRQIIDLIHYIRTLNFEDDPDYGLIRSLLRQSLPFGIENHNLIILDWELKLGRKIN